MSSLPKNIFGCSIFVNTYAQNRIKLYPRALKCLFLRYSSTQKGDKLYSTITKRLYVSRDVTFLEYQTYFPKTQLKEEILRNSNSNQFLDITFPTPVFASTTSTTPVTTSNSSPETIIVSFEADSASNLLANFAPNLPIDFALNLLAYSAPNLLIAYAPNLPVDSTLKPDSTLNFLANLTLKPDSTPNFLANLTPKPGFAPNLPTNFTLELQVYSRKKVVKDIETPTPSTHGQLTEPNSDPNDQNSSNTITDTNMTVLNDLDVPITFQKGVRSCTTHPIVDFVSYEILSPQFRAFTAIFSKIDIPRDIHKALQHPNWKIVVHEEIKALEKN